MGDEIQDYLKTAMEVAKEAGERVKTDFYKVKNIEVKENFADLVTETDKAVEDLIALRFKEKYPSHKFIGEETVSAGGKCELTDDPTWIIDPIDGTSNFVHGVDPDQMVSNSPSDQGPHCSLLISILGTPKDKTCNQFNLSRFYRLVYLGLNISYTSISIALAVNKKIVVGLVHCPVLGDTYSAMKGGGAFCNGEKMKVSTISELKRSVVILEGGSSRIPEILQAKMDNMKAVIENSHGIRCYGSAAMNMCGIARGTHEVYLEHGIHVWDIAAGALVVEEAGGVVIDPSGGPVDLFNRRVLAACSSSVANELSRVIKNIDMERD